MKASECSTSEGEFGLRPLKIDADRKKHITLPFQSLACAETPFKESSSRHADTREEQ